MTIHNAQLHTQKLNSNYAECWQSSIIKLY